MVDYRDQQHTGQLLSLLEFHGRGPGEWMTAVDPIGLLYEGVRQSRTAIVTDDYVLDVFQLSAHAPRTFHWITHTLGAHESLKSSPAPQPCARKLPASGKWLRDLRQAACDETIRIELSEDSVQLRITIAAQAGTVLLTCGYPLTDESDSPLSPMILLERKAKSTVYAVLYQAGRGDLPQLELKSMPSVNGRLQFKVSGPSINRKHSVYFLSRQGQSE